MRSLVAILVFAVLPFGFVGCSGNFFRNPHNLTDPQEITVVDVWSDANSYIVVFEHKERFAMVRVEKDTFESVREGNKVEVELISATTTEDNRYFLELEYCWHIGDHDYKVIFPWDATERPVRSGYEPDKY